MKLCHSVALLFLVLTLRPAVADPTLGVPVGQSANVGLPVEINECSVLYTGGWLVGATAGVKVEFTNDTTKTADVINFYVTDGSHGGNIRDVGSFAPGIEVRHHYRAGGGQMMFSPLFSHPHITCSLASVHFTDGTVWRPASVIETGAGNGASEVTVAPSDTLVSNPQEIDLTTRGSTNSRVLTITDAQKTDSFAYSDSCGGIITIAEISHNDFEIALNVTAAKAGICALNVRNSRGSEALVVVKVTS